jgi:tripartite ATP-independent transporter DctM subunit
VASPTEVAGLGAVMALIIALVRGRVRWPAIHRAALTTVRQTTMIVFIITTAKLFALTLIYYQLPNKLVAWAEATGTSPLNLVLGVCLLYLVMGMFFDGLSMMVITIPFVVPMMSAVNVDLIWLGVLICMMIEIGLLTPPVGLNLFVLQGATGEPIRDIVMGSLPFIVLLFVTLALVMVFPAVALYLPSLM